MRACGPGYNQLASLVPSSLSCCPGLGVLDVSNNRLTELPDAIADCAQLHTLDVSNNDLGDLPYQLGYMTALTRIQIVGNPLRRMRRSLVTAGAETLKKYDSWWWITQRSPRITH